MKFSAIAILGTGRLALDCAVHSKEYNIPLKIYDMNLKPSDLLKRQAAHFGFECVWMPKEDTFWDLYRTDESTLLISAINPCILPDNLLKKPNMTAINCHQALLPKHPGRNAEMWAIYEGDEKTGITWHLMTAQVDGGDILVQKEFPLTDSLTAYQVFRKQMAAALEGFKDIIGPLLTGDIKGRRQPAHLQQKLHYSWDMPNDGILDWGWDGHKISAFLRATDYAGLSVLKPIKILIDGRYYSWRKYVISRDVEPSVPEIKFQDSTIFLTKDGYQINLQHYKEEL